MNLVGLDCGGRVDRKLENKLGPNTATRGQSNTDTCRRDGINSGRDEETAGGDRSGVKWWQNSDVSSDTRSSYSPKGRK